jgi:GNAT superfamily N-acetyltransferase
MSPKPTKESSMNAAPVLGFAVPPKTVIKKSSSSKSSGSAGVEICAATPDMLQEAAAVCERAFLSAFTRLAPVNRDFWLQDMRQTVERADRLVLVARHGGKVIGGQSMGLFRAPYSADVWYALEQGLWVEPEYRAQGVDELLRAAGEAWARSQGAQFVMTVLYVPEEPAGPKRSKRKAALSEVEHASALYRRNGYGLAELRFVKELG